MFFRKFPDTGGLDPFAFGTGPVAHNLLIQQHSEGSVEFAIDSEHSFSLGPRLAEIFQFLASGDKDQSGKDELVGWRRKVAVLWVSGCPSGVWFATFREARVPADLVALFLYARWIRFCRWV
jgi:hypothetical protein